MSADFKLLCEAVNKESVRPDEKSESADPVRLLNMLKLTCSDAENST